MKSVLQHKKECYVTGQTLGLHEHHVFQGVNRKNSEKRGFKVWLIGYWHTLSDVSVHMNPNKGLDLELKQKAQEYYEEHYGTRDDFRREFGKSYLD